METHSACSEQDQCAMIYDASHWLRLVIVLCLRGVICPPSCVQETEEEMEEIRI